MVDDDLTHTAYADCRLSHEEAHISVVCYKPLLSILKQFQDTSVRHENSSL